MHHTSYQPVIIFLDIFQNISRLLSTTLSYKKLSQKITISHCDKPTAPPLITARRFLLWDNLGFYLLQSKYWINILLIIVKIRVRWTRISDMLLNRKLLKCCRECSHEVVRFLFFVALLNVFIVDPGGGDFRWNYWQDVFELSSNGLFVSTRCLLPDTAILKRIIFSIGRRCNKSLCS